MTTAITVWIVLIGILSVSTILAIWSRRPTRARGFSVAAFVLSAGLSAVALGSSLGWAVPLINGLTAPSGTWVVLGTKIIVGEGIYMLLDIEGREPRHFSLPWDKDMADKLQDMLNNGDTPTMTIPLFEFSWDMRKPELQPLPQPKALPDKPHEEPKRYDRSV